MSTLAGSSSFWVIYAEDLEKEEKAFLSEYFWGHMEENFIKEENDLKWQGKELFWESGNWDLFKKNNWASVFKIEDIYFIYFLIYSFFFFFHFVQMSISISLEESFQHSRGNIQCK